MNKNTQKKLLIAGGIAAAVGVGYWYFFMGPGATPATTSSSSTSSTTPGSSAWTNPANAAAAQTIATWVPQTPATWQSFFNSYMPTATTAEIQNMAAIIAVWNGAPASTALSNWWYAFSAAHGLS